MSNDAEKLTDIIVDICNRVIDAARDNSIYFMPRGLTINDWFRPAVTLHKDPAIHELPVTKLVTIEFYMYDKDLFSDIKGATDE